MPSYYDMKKIATNLKNTYFNKGMRTKGFVKVITELIKFFESKDLWAEQSFYDFCRVPLEEMCKANRVGGSKTSILQGRLFSLSAGCLVRLPTQE